MDKDTRLILTVRVDPKTGEVMTSRMMPGFRFGPPEEGPVRLVKPRIDKEKALKVAKEEVEKGLDVGTIYKNPRGWYIVEVKDKEGKVIATVSSDGKLVW